MYLCCNSKTLYDNDIIYIYILMVFFLIRNYINNFFQKKKIIGFKIIKVWYVRYLYHIHDSVVFLY